MDIPFPPSAPPASKAPTLEESARPLLRSLASLTGLETAYLTRVDEARDALDVVYATNARPEELKVVEGSHLAWKDSICRRAIQDQTPATDRADELWRDVPAVQDLGVRTYVGEPIWDTHGDLLGTLCVVSHRQVPVDADTREIVALFARIVAHQAERERKQVGEPNGE